jgi:hypothetical protein
MEEIPSGAMRLIDRLRTGDNQALAELFDQYRDRLRRMVDLRMDPRLRARLDVSDVLQEAYMELAGDLDAYRADLKLPPLLWMRLHVGRRLTTLRRRHLGGRLRDAGLEISLNCRVRETHQFLYLIPRCIPRTLRSGRDAWWLGGDLTDVNEHQLRGLRAI